MFFKIKPKSSNSSTVLTHVIFQRQMVAKEAHYVSEAWFIEIRNPAIIWVQGLLRSTALAVSK